MTDRDRLTKRQGTYVYINKDTIPRKDCEGKMGFHFCQYERKCRSIVQRKCPVLRVLDKLAYYEDLEEQGRLIVPPCKVGQTVYVPWHWNGEQGIGVVEVEEIKIYDSQNHIMFLIDMESDDEEFNQSFGGWKIEKSIGKTVFLTKEEAETKLRSDTE